MMLSDMMLSEAVAKYKNIDRYSERDRTTIEDIRLMMTDKEAVMFDKCVGQSGSPLGMIGNLVADGLRYRESMKKTS